MQAEVVSDGPAFGEGPVWCPDGTLVVTSVSEGALFRIWPESGRREQIASTGGGANGAALASDGGFVITQNGGLDFAAIGMFENPPPRNPAQSGLQRVDPDGRVSYLTPDTLQAPNDLVVDGTGAIWFTDPPTYPLPPGNHGRVMRLDPDGALHVVADGFVYPNGIGLDPDGVLIVVANSGFRGGDDWGLVLLHRDGTREVFAPRRAADGFAVDVEGRLYVAGGMHGVTVLDPDGSEVDQLEIPGPGVTTNCCFGGADGRTLFATDAVPGQVVAWEGMPSPGLPMHPWPVPGV